MKDEPTPRGQEGSYSEDDRLVKELESSNKTTGSFDSMEDVSDIDEDPGIYYRILRINPEASLTEIHDAFEKMNEAWHPDRYPHVISWNEKSKNKIKEIRYAYEKLLRFHQRRAGASQVDVASTPLPATKAVRQEYPAREGRPLSTLTARSATNTAATSSSPSDDGNPGSSTAKGLTGNLRRRVIVIGLPTVIIFILILLWPSLYHYEVINLGGKEFPLRINRITSHTSYFNGREWLIPPIQSEMRSRIAAPAIPVQPVPPLQSVAPPASPIQPQQPVQPTQATPSPQAAQPLPPPLASDSSKAEFSAVSKPSSLPKPKVEPQPAKREAPPLKVAETKANFGKPYSIQITAYPEKDKAATLAKRLRGAKLPVRVEEVVIKEKGRWYRVLLGKFKNRTDALKYFHDHNIGKLYPSSFIQKSTNN